MSKFNVKKGQVGITLGGKHYRAKGGQVDIPEDFDDDAISHGMTLVDAGDGAGDGGEYGGDGSSKTDKT